ncbi:FAD-binding oxidoreductase [Notoacmeibacter sp. MSK16QG-6]|uniref:FAD-binding oxidoreductase n=1 Tax=Notoacmeibacter sp. MSK16QG-6 TaxID=2957982 RepID=UPI0020A12F84|nr:FAD-binding oxidoreductase [Notoacmeibacter sp. MSK16QG-6]MCP1199561.1 FAD-binding oxidoreductase [Notoacmeibacter sp. MSK16QG-6]
MSIKGAHSACNEPTDGETLLLDRLRKAVGSKHVLTEGTALAGALSEERGLYKGNALALVRPANVEQVSEVVRLCYETGVSIVPQGGNTGLVGGGVPNGGIVLSTGRLNKIFDIDRVNATITAGSGCILAEIQQAADDAGALFPLSLASEGSCQIGGNLATNAGGTAVLRYGNTRDLVLGIEAVLPDGRILSDLNGLRKNNMGYDLKNLLIGSEGTLGVITAVVLKLFPKPVQRMTALAACTDSQAALDFYGMMRTKNADILSAFEFINRFALQTVLDHGGGSDPFGDIHPCYCLIELSSINPDDELRSRLEATLTEAFETGAVLDAVIGASETQNEALWQLRERIAESQKFEGASIKHDVSLPVSKLAEFIEEAVAACLDHVPNVRPCYFGHFGDGNLHFNFTRPKDMSDADFLAEYASVNRIVHDIVNRMSGSISAEHGIGRTKREDLHRYKDPVAIEVMRQIKSALDPKGLMNPGKVL